jgi:ubiquinone/menaquinone biosynthesis C-methylase UbiE
MPKLSMPAPDANGGVHTLNNMGGMVPYIDILTGRFLDIVRAMPSGSKVLEIGAAYGNVVLKILNETSVTITANDMDYRHIEILYDRALECCSNKINRLQLDVSDFSRNSTFSTESFEAILAARVFHFFTPVEFKNAIAKLYDILLPGGSVYILGISAYSFPLFMPEYEKKLSEGYEWPGYVTNIQVYANKSETDENIYNGMFNKSFNFFNAELIARHFEEHGFLVQEAFGFSFDEGSNDYIYDTEGRWVGLIATKVAGDTFDKDEL